jgi:hypothetical protein
MDTPPALKRAVWVYSQAARMLTLPPEVWGRRGFFVAYAC